MTQSCNELLREDKGVFDRRTAVILLPIVLVAAVLRLIHFGQSPPGMNQDEAVNAWTAWSLLNTGKDQYGISWPIFYYRGLGGNNTTLFMYLLMPFQIIGGMSVITTRLPAAICGILTIPLIYYVGSRMFDRRVGLLAALILTFNPWHLQLSRWGHEACIAPLLGLLPVVIMLWANFPLGDNAVCEPKILRAALAGAVTGIVCYGYYAVRVFVPLFLFVVVLVTIPAWWRFVKNRRGLSAVIAFIVVFCIIFLPMVWLYIFDYDGIARHNTFLLKPWDNLAFAAKMKNLAARYINHFGPDFLFIRGDISEIQKLPGVGQFHWYTLPLMLTGLIFLFLRFKQSVSMRVLFTLVFVYPISDSLCYAYGMHALRSAPGLCGLVLLGAAGGVTMAQWLCKKSKVVVLGLAVAFFVAAVFLNVRYLDRFYGDYNRQSKTYSLFHTDYLKACAWLKPRFDDYDIIFCTTYELNMPYMLALVAMDYDPKRWFTDRKDFFTYEEWDYYTRWGKMVFLHRGMLLPDPKELKKKAVGKHILYIMRPGELGLTDPIYRVTGPDGKDTLWLCEL